MAVAGDIIRINYYVDSDGNPVKPHPFIVLAAENGVINGKRYNLIAVACSSYKNPQDKATLGLRNKTIVNIYPSDGVKKDSFVKCGTLVYFNNQYYQVLGSISDRAWDVIERKVTDLDDDGILEDNTRNL